MTPLQSLLLHDTSKARCYTTLLQLHGTSKARYYTAPLQNLLLHDTLKPITTLHL